MSWWAPEGVSSIGPLKGGKWDEHGRPTDKRLRRVACACGCKTKFQTTDPRRKYFDERHKRRAQYRSATDKAQRKRRLARIQARTDLTCEWCQAKSTETKWSKSLRECLPCNRARARCACPECGAPVSLRVARSRCVRCDPKPKGFVEVILLDAGSDRERTVWRLGNVGQWITISRQATKVTSDPLVVTLPTAKWIRTRR